MAEQNNIALDSDSKNSEPKRYLVIKHGALGDFILACGAFEAIRRRHPKSHITLLTTPPFEALAKQSPYFDEVWIDTRPGFWEFPLLIALIKKLRAGGFRMVYDLQTSSRSNLYFRLMGRKKPLWSGIIEWCSHPHRNPNRIHMHTVERLKEQLYIARISRVYKSDLSWLTSDISRFNLPQHYAVIVAGGSAHRPEKRWTEKGFAEVARFLFQEGITPVFIGTKAEETQIKNIVKLCNGAVNLCGQTSFADIASLARGARLALGNDTGPMHILAAVDTRSIVFFSQFSDPKLCAPRGKMVRIMQEENLPDLKTKDVISMIKEVLDLGVPEQIRIMG